MEEREDPELEELSSRVRKELSREVSDGYVSSCTQVACGLDSLLYSAVPWIVTKP